MSDPLDYAAPTDRPAASLSGLAGLADIVLRPGRLTTDRSPRLLTPVYDALRRSFSGTTWYLAQAGMEEAILEGAFTLNRGGRFNPSLAATGALWKLQRRLRGRTHGGFKYVPAFHDILWSQSIDRFAGMTIINNFQIFGGFFLKRFARLGITPCFFIDGTLTEYFYGYGAVENGEINADIADRAIAMEREGYANAARVITMSSASARHLIEVYDVPPARVAVVIPGANIDDAAIPPPSLHEGWAGDQFTLGFIGLFPLRKGLDKLAEAVRLLRNRGAPIRLRVIGRCPEAIAAMDGVEFLGAIDKAASTEQFVAAIRTVDLGCQLSRAELLGIAVLEFLRMGVPVMATAVGGVPDVLRDGGGFLLPADVTAEAVAEALQAVMEDSVRYRALRREAAARSGWAGWRRAAREIDAALAPLG